MKLCPVFWDLSASQSEPRGLWRETQRFRVCMRQQSSTSTSELKESGRASPRHTPRGNKTHWSASRSVLSTATAHRCSLQRNMIPSQRRHCHAAFGAFQGIGKAALPRDTFSRHLHGCWAASSLLPSMSCSSPIKLELPFTLTPVIFPILRLL